MRAFFGGKFDLEDLLCVKELTYRNSDDIVGSPWFTLLLFHSQDLVGWSVIANLSLLFAPFYFNHFLFASLFFLDPHHNLFTRHYLILSYVCYQLPFASPILPLSYPLSSSVILSRFPLLSYSPVVLYRCHPLSYSPVVLPLVIEPVSKSVAVGSPNWHTLTFPGLSPTH